MALSTSLKQKVDAENQSFNEEWTEKYVFIRQLLKMLYLPASFAMKLSLSDICEKFIKGKIIIATSLSSFSIEDWLWHKLLFVTGLVVMDSKCRNSQEVV